MIRIGLGSSSVYPQGVEAAFSAAAKLGYDGVEVMVTRESETQSAEPLRRLAERYGVPVMSIHAPVLLYTHFVWGTDPAEKLERAAELADELGARTVVVHPPFRWQSGYAEMFEDLVRDISGRHDTAIAVENMFPWRMAKRELRAYAPHYDVRRLASDAATLDFSHAALSGHDSLELAKTLGPRLRHIHLTDGTYPAEEGHLFDEHLLPGTGTQPVAQTLRMLADAGWDGDVVAEVNTRRASEGPRRLQMLQYTLEFAREHTAPSSPASGDGSSPPLGEASILDNAASD